MKVKLALLIGAATGYVFGTRDGRARYEQMRAKAQEVWADPKVQAQVERATEAAGDAAGQAAKKAGSAATAAAAKVKDRTTSSSSDLDNPEWAPATGAE